MWIQGDVVNIIAAICLAVVAAIACLRRFRISVRVGKGGLVFHASPADPRRIG
jgi:hypothetical protein